MITLKIDDPKLEESVANGGDLLKDLCRKEANLFDSYVRQEIALFREGLSEFERVIIARYIYWKLMDKSPVPEDLPIDQGQ